MLKRLAIKWIERYQAKGGERQFAVNCNFHPTCSEYTKQSIQRFGLLSGIKLGWHRIRRCNQPDLIKPIDDPVPTSLEKK
ncbi:MAG: membrane protein insertion efficiency factor YidD [Kangiellaceae bacterium]|jgi:putative component of membrane protein insertase Oxa1/YidC/SpoIIIJ protein YidD|nr:membrane protein insertion efficiency factor YidD [Kangiellaceae bacterium]